jgi:anti-anti-sigma factor
MSGAGRKGAIMVAHVDHYGLEAEHIGNVTVVTFTDSELLDEDTIETVGKQLYGLVDKLDTRHLVLNLAAVRRLSTMMLGKLVALNKRVRTSGGRLVLCRIDPDLHKIFGILNLPPPLPIYCREQEALQTF